MSEIAFVILIPRLKRKGSSSLTGFFAYASVSEKYRLDLVSARGLSRTLRSALGFRRSLRLRRLFGVVGLIAFRVVFGLLVVRFLTRQTVLQQLFFSSHSNTL